MSTLIYSGNGYYDERLEHIDCYHALIRAIIKLACRDYVAAVKRHKTYESKQLEEYFRSDHFALLTGGVIDPDYLISRLRRQAKSGKIRQRLKEE